MSDSLDGSDLQFLVDSTFQISLSPHQHELLCLSILNAAMLVNRKQTSPALQEGPDDAYNIWESIKNNRVLRELKHESFPCQE